MRTDLRGAEKALREETGCKPTAELLQLLIGLQDVPKLVRFFGAFQTETTVKWTLLNIFLANLAKNIGILSGSP